MSVRSITALVFLVRLAYPAALCFAQVGSSRDSTGQSPASPVMTVEDVMHSRQPTQHPAEGISRWFETSTAAVAIRYRLLAPDGGARVSQVQSTIAVRGRFKVDGRGRYALHAGLATGRGFRGGWNDTGIGSGTPTYDLFVKELFVAARPRPWLALEGGGLYLLRGESTEATSYDNDGHIVGERVTMRQTSLKLCDELSITRAFLGDLSQSSVFARFHGLGRANYYQVLATKRVAHSAALSVDYTSQDDIDVIRAAAVVSWQRAVIVDRLRLETYARLDPAPSSGFAVIAQRGFRRRFTGGGGLSDIDPQYPTLNSDLHGRGRRMFGSIGLRLGSAWIASAQVARAVGNSPIVGPRTRVDVAVGYDVATALRSRGGCPR